MLCCREDILLQSANCNGSYPLGIRCAPHVMRVSMHSGVIPRPMNMIVFSIMSNHYSRGNTMKDAQDMMGYCMIAISVKNSHAI